MGGGKGSQKQPVYDYFMSIQYGICHGPIDSFNELFIKETSVWKGETSGNFVIGLDQPELFGGDSKEGGIRGNVEVYDGAADQVMSEEIAGRVGLTSATMPGYRGLSNVFFRGDAAGGGFKWTANNPYLPGAWCNVTRLGRTISGINPAIRASYGPLGSQDDGAAQSTPAHGDLNIYINPAPGAWRNRGPATAFYAAVDHPTDEGVLGLRVGTDGLDNTVTYRDVRLYDYGVTDEDIDSGLVPFTITGDFAATAGRADIALKLRPFRNNANGEADSENQTDSELIANFGLDNRLAPFTETQTVVGTIPAGTRWLRVLVDAVDAGYVTIRDFEINGIPITIDECLAGPLVQPDMNPASIIHECLVDTDWGRGLPPTLIDEASFVEAASTLADERFGLSFSWQEQADVETIIEEVLDHIQASLFANPATGLLTLKLFRDDYVEGDLDLLDTTNSEVTKFQRKTWAETINEIIVSWTSPETELEETVTYHDLANIAIQGGIVSDGRNYYAIRNARLANTVGGRDIRSASAPVATATVKTTRQFWRTVPGDVFKLASPEDGVEEIIVRVTKVDRGGRGSMPLTLTVTEDVFGLESSAFTSVGSSAWVDPDSEPEPFDTVEVQTAPRAMMVSAAGIDATDDVEPRVMSVVLAKKNSLDVSEFDLVGPRTLVNGTNTTEVRETMIPTDYGLLAVAWDQIETTLAATGFFDSFVGVVGPEVATLAMIGSGEGQHEIVMFDSVDGAGTFTVARGMLDTVPKAWPIGTPIWFLNSAFTGVDEYDMVYGETFDYRLLPRTSLGRLDEADAPLVPVALTDRPYLPFRPANVEIEGELWGTAFVASGDTATVTWSNRDRFMEDTLLQRWTASNVTPEAGQTVTVVQKDLSDNVLATFAGLTGTSAEIDVASALPSGEQFCYLEIWSDRDGLLSLQAVKRLVEVEFFGYGANYGNSYGE